MTKLHEYGRIILKTLNDASFEAYFVGGFVRDHLLGNPTHDIDITTNARPNDVRTLFEKVIPTGRAFGTMTVLIDGVPFEVTTYRMETVYDNHRHPKEIRFADTLIEDLKRRDFTINQLTMDKEDRIMDHFDGLRDLKDKKIRTINDPDERFFEDALRMLRAFRFMAKLDFELGNETARGITTNKDLIRKISIERVQEELFKLLESPCNKKALRAMVDTGFAEALYGLGHRIRLLADTNVAFDKETALVIMFKDERLDEGQWKLSNQLKDTIRRATKAHMETFESGFRPIDLYTYGKAICMIANTVNMIYGDMDQSAMIESLDDSLKVRSLKELKLTGGDIKKHFPITHPSQIGWLLERLLEDVLDGEVKNTRSELKRKAMEYLKSHESEQ